MYSPLRTLTDPTPRDIPEDVVDFLRLLEGPTWIECQGTDMTRTRVVVTLLHGNEPSGVRAVQQWLRAGKTPATRVVFVIASVTTALTPPLFSHRMLPDALDANRCFTPPFHGPIAERAGELLGLLESSSAEALIDLHNTSGHNPAYGVGFGVDAARLHLTALFADRYMNSDLRLNTLVEATGAWFPSVSLECGRADDPAADAVALAGLERFLLLDRLPLAEPAPTHIAVLEEPLRVVLQPQTSLAFAEAPRLGADLTIRHNLDHYNFEWFQTGELVGWVTHDARWPVAAYDRTGRDLARDLFTLDAGTLRAKRAFVPVMMTTNPEIAKRDCLFYAMLSSSGRPLNG